MSKFYTDEHRALQDKFDTRRMADLMEGGLVHNEFSPEESTFINTSDMFFLSTVDHNGRPTVSYKGGAPGFIKATGPASLAFPSYDGNGMFYSMGNLANAPKVGLLFIDFETPHRLRVHGSAKIVHDDPAMKDYSEAQFMIHIEVDEIWVNCPRYIHRYKKLEQSKYVPSENEKAPAPAWKRIDFAQDALPARDQGKADENGGLISMDEYEQLVAKGEA